METINIDHLEWRYPHVDRWLFHDGLGSNSKFYYNAQNLNLHYEIYFNNRYIYGNNEYKQI